MIELVCGHRSRIGRTAIAGWSRIEAEFSWDRIAKRTEDVYLKVLGLDKVAVEDARIEEVRPPA